MADLPELTPLRQVWPTQRDERTGKRPPKENESVKRRPEQRRDRSPREDDRNGKIDEYA